MFRDIREVERHYVYQYQHLDDLTFLRTPQEVFENTGVQQDPDEWTNAVANLLRRSGWEGDGEIQIMWFPPFVDIEPEDTWGSYVWVVKQGNNGVSFIASARPLRFPRLLEQNSHRR